MDKKDLKPEVVYTEDTPKPTSNTLMDMVQYMNALDEAIAESAQNNLGEIDLELEEKLILVKERALPSKIDGYSFILDALKFRREFWKSKKDEIGRVISAIDKYEEKLKEVLIGAMLRLETTELLGNESRYILVNSKEKVIIDDPSKIPSGHIEIVQTQTIKKESIYEDLKAGIPVSGAHLEVSQYVKRSLNVKGVKENAKRNNQKREIDAVHAPDDAGSGGVDKKDSSEGVNG
jgi:hypothetical protein